MALKSDAQGFLVGTPVELGRALDVWDSIRRDVRAIRAAVSGMEKVGARERNAVAAKVNAAPRAEPKAGKARKNDLSASISWPAVPRSPALPKKRTSHDAGDGKASIPVNHSRTRTPSNTAAVVAEPLGRDSRGRFQKRSAHPENGGDDKNRRRGDDGDESISERALNEISERMVGALGEAGSGVEEADPAVKAMREATQPLARGYEMIRGRKDERRREGWLRKILGELKLFRQEETAYSKAAKRSLEAIEEKPAGAAGGGMFSGLLSGLLPKIPFFGTRFGGKAPHVAGAGGLRGLGKGMLRRVPMLGVLLGGLGLASEVFGSETDDTATRQQKDRRTGKALGGFAGSLGGMVAGAKLGALVGAIGGPVGAALGGAIGGAVGLFLGDQAGQVIGETVGGWVSDLRRADLPGKISAAWDGAVSAVKAGWAAVVSKFNGVIERIGNGWEAVKNRTNATIEGGRLLAEEVTGKVAEIREGASRWVTDRTDSANAFVKDKTGLDLKAGAAKAVSTVREKAVVAGAQAAVGIRKGMEWAAENTMPGQIAAQAATGVQRAADWVLGQTSKRFESGSGGAGTVSSGNGDYGGVSYGTYQLSSRQGTLQRFLRSSPFGTQFDGLTPGTPEFNTRWKTLAESDSSFGAAQHEFIKKTHYVPALENLKKAGIDLSGRGAAVQDALWSTSVQFGAGNEKAGAVALFKKALAGKNLDALSDREIVAALQDYKLAHNDTLFSRSSDKVRAGTAQRAIDEKKRLLALADRTPVTVMPPQAEIPSVMDRAAVPPVVASTRTAPVSVAPPAPAIAPAPAVSVPAGSGASRTVAVVAPAAQEAGQDVRDRRIAHIATGGLSGT